MHQQATNILELVNAGRALFPGDVYMASKENGEWTTISPDEFFRDVRNVALGLYELGVRPGDHVSLHSRNCIEWMVCDQAILSIGASSVPIYTSQPGEQIKYILNHSDTKVHIVRDDRQFSETKGLIKSIECVKAVISIKPTSHGKLYTLHDVKEKGAKLDRQKPKLFEKLRDDVEPESLATIIYTSGTTGLPKGVMLTHNNLTSNVEAALERIPFDFDANRGERMLSYLPLSHVFERIITYLYLRIGYPMYFIEKVEEIKEDLQVVKPFFFATVPRLLEKIHVGVKGRGQEMSGLQKALYYWAIHLAEKFDPEHPPRGIDWIKHKIADRLVYRKIRNVFGGRLLGFISGGAALSPNIMRFMNAIGFYGGQGYGLSETSPVIAVTDGDHLRVGSSGLPMRDVKVRTAEDGEIQVIGPNVMKGYFHDPERTEDAFTKDGWFKTGDIGYLDEDGYLFVTDRKKSMFKMSTGKYVAPQPIENRLGESPFIEQAVVVGNQRKFCAALLVPDFANVRKRLKRDNIDLPDDPADCTENNALCQLIRQEVDKVNEELPAWERIKKFVLLKEPFTIESGELTPTLKIKRPVVNKRYKEQIDSLYESSDNVFQES